MQLATSNLLAPNPALAGFPFPGTAPVPQATAEPTAGSAGFPGSSPKALAMKAAAPDLTGAVALSFLPPMASGAWHAAPPLIAGGDLMADGGWDITSGGMPCGVMLAEETPGLPADADAQRLAEALANSGVLPIPLPVEADMPLHVAECPASPSSGEEPTPGPELDEPAFEPRRNTAVVSAPPTPLRNETMETEAAPNFALPTHDAGEGEPTNDTFRLPLAEAQTKPGVSVAADVTRNARVNVDLPAEALPSSAETTNGLDPLPDAEDFPAAPTAVSKVAAASAVSANLEPDVERLLAAVNPVQTSLRRWENSADLPGYSASDRGDGEMSSEKSFVTNGGVKVTRRQAVAGIETANSAPVMPNSALVSPHAQPAVAATSALMTGAEGLVERVEPQNMLALALDDVRTAHEAVEVVLRTADRLASLTHKSVKLEFAVAGERLDVRVELRANEVLTTFHTESAELRAALAQEWQGVSASTGQGERTLRLLPADFGSAGNDTAQSSAGDAHSRQREAAQQQQLVTENAPYFGRATRGSRGTRTTAVAPVADVSFAAPTTALHLHTLA